MILLSKINSYVIRRSLRRYSSGFSAGVLALLLSCAGPSHALATVEQQLDVLKVGTQVYRNVTVTTKRKDYVLILHSAGLASLKVSELSEENLVALGYKEPPPKPALELKAPAKPPAPAPVPTQKVASVRDVQPQSKGLTLHIDPAMLPKISMRMIVTTILVLAAFHVFFSYCGLRICGKTGLKPGAMIWLPLLQLIPMFCAAGMSPLWVIGMPLPIVNVVALVIWSFRIAKACQKGPFVGVCLLVPGVNLIAFAYLAFCTVIEPDAEATGSAMTLQTA